VDKRKSLTLADGSMRYWAWLQASTSQTVQLYCEVALAGVTAADRGPARPRP